MSENRDKVTLVIGLGEVGQPLCEVLQSGGSKIIGIDLEPFTVEVPVSVMHVCFPFKDSGQFQDAVAAYARKYSPEVIVINSTVVPGTTRAIEAACMIPAVYSPVRGKHTKMLDEIHSYAKFVAGADAEATERVMEHFESVGLRCESMSSPEALELAKLLETTYFGLLIAWAQEMSRFAGAVNADYLEIGRFFREIAYLPGVLFQPGYIGGHCVMPNIELLQLRYQSDFLNAVKKSNDTRKHELEAGQLQPADNRLQPLILK